MLGGVHPNCESMTLLVSEGSRYRGVNHYLMIGLREPARQLVARGERIRERLERLDPEKPLQGLRGQLLVLRTYLPVVFRALDPKRYCRGDPLAAGLRIAAGLLRGRRFRHLAREHLVVRRVLRLAVLPFEEYHSIDAARLENCKAAFAYEDVDEECIKKVPACMWYEYRDPILRRIAEPYGSAAGSEPAERARRDAKVPASRRSRVGPPPDRTSGVNTGTCCSW